VVGHHELVSIFLFLANGESDQVGTAIEGDQQEKNGNGRELIESRCSSTEPPMDDRTPVDLSSELFRSAVMRVMKGRF
jgi:hypothetical protein